MKRIISKCVWACENHDKCRVNAEHRSVIKEENTFRLYNPDACAFKSWRTRRGMPADGWDTKEINFVKQKASVGDLVLLTSQGTTTNPFAVKHYGLVTHVCKTRRYYKILWTLISGPVAHLWNKENERRQGEYSWEQYHCFEILSKAS